MPEEPHFARLYIDPRIDLFTLYDQVTALGYRLRGDEVRYRVILEAPGQEAQPA